MANSLQFGRSMGVAQFKEHHNISTLEIIRNPNTGKLFFSSPEDSSVSGAVSKGDWKSDPVFTEVSDPNGGETFWMLHKRGSGGSQNVVDTL